MYIYEFLEKPMVKLLAQMEIEGIKIDEDFFFRWVRKVNIAAGPVWTVPVCLTLSGERICAVARLLPPSKFTTRERSVIVRRSSESQNAPADAQ